MASLFLDMLDNVQVCPPPTPTSPLINAIVIVVAEHSRGQALAVSTSGRDSDEFQENDPREPLQQVKPERLTLQFTPISPSLYTRPTLLGQVSVILPFLCRADSPFFLMLLSTKAGGVGLNLVGGL